jgi:uncharacterized membrane-anchored protein
MHLFERIGIVMLINYATSRFSVISFPMSKLLIMTHTKQLLENMNERYVSVIDSLDDSRMNVFNVLEKATVVFTNSASSELAVNHFFFAVRLMR